MEVPVDLDQCKKRRRAARGWLTRQNRRIRDLLDQETIDIDLDHLRQEIKELEVKLANLEIVQKEVENYLDDDILDEDIEQADEFLNESREVKRRAEKVLINSPAEDSRHGHLFVQEGVQRQNDVSTAQLPKIQIQRFSGQYEEWPEFFDKFIAMVDKTNLSTIAKFTHLQSLLDGEASATIKGLSLTENNYNIAITILKDRYGRKERIIFAHIQRLLNIEVNNVKSTSNLWQLYNELQTNIRSLENLGVSGEAYGVVLTPMVLSRLPSVFRLEWARISDGREGDLEWMLNFLKEEISRRERSETYEHSNSVDSSSSSFERKRKSVGRTPSAAVLQNRQFDKGDGLCCFCEKRHPSNKCWNLKTMKAELIKSKLRENNLCFRCFKSDHVAKDCRMNCELCMGKHNKYFCNNKKTSEHSRSGDQGSDNSANINNYRNDSANYHHSTITNKVSVMQVVSVVLNNKTCTVFFDSGSDKSYITTSCVKEIKPKFVGNEYVSYACFGEKRPRHPTKRNVYEIDYAMSNGNKKSFTVTEIPTITVPMYREKIPENVLDEFRNLGLSSLANKYTKDENICVNILIGLDAYWNLMTQKSFRTSHGLVAQESVFGWFICGNYPFQGKDNLRSGIHHQNLCCTDISESLIRSFWELEHIGIKANETERRPDETLQLFNNNVNFDGDRYEVGLPWKEEKKRVLMNNFDHAMKRLNNLEKKLDKDPKLKERYQGVLRDLENEGIFEEVGGVEENHYPVFYLPHRPVVKETSTTTKVRPVFDASAAGPNGVTLNSCMNTGPNMTNGLLEVLLRFRRWKYAMSGDITKAFFQIKVKKEDQDVHRFLVKENGKLRVMRITRVPFGNTCSPFLLNATIKHHLACQPTSRAIEELFDNLYVDDWLTGADSVDELSSLKEEAQTVMNKAAMPLTKWTSNSAKVADQKEHVIQEKEEVNEQKVLGIRWNPVEDSFSFVDLEIFYPNLLITRRVVLSLISKVFDPFGFLQPFVMVGKIIFQSLWKDGLQWDDPIPEEKEKSFIQWMKQLNRLHDFHIPRSYVNCSWEKKKDLELHAFSDASEKAFGSCIYMRIVEKDGNVSISLVIAKAKLCPVKRVTLPRLELLGALLSARLLNYVKKALSLPESTKYRCWTDSKVALQWIQSDANKWKTFVANRVTEIQALTSPAAWGHCPGAENPADIVSRGMLLDSLLSSNLWLNGPPWLFEDNHDSNSNQFINEVSEFETKEENEVGMQLNVDSQFEPVPLERWGEFSKALRIVSWMVRFISNCRRSKETRNLSSELKVEEIHTGKVLLLKIVQTQHFSNEVNCLEKGVDIPRSSKLYKLNPFLDKEGLLRLKGRLQFAGLSIGSQHPIILPGCHLSELIIRREHSVSKHAGVPQMITSIRDEYWIIGIRRLAKRVKGKCPRCIRFDSTPCQQPMAPLPKERVQRSEPFSVVGVDHAGPLFSADNPGKKHYICLFTCGVIRAVHLELVDDLSLEQFMLAFRRFVSRRRLPLIILSDQARTFLAATKRLIEIYAERAPNWKFITPRSPWVGGMWERCVRSVKSCLRKCLGNRCLSRLELTTLMYEIEQCINNRPLTFVGDTIDSSEILTPNHFLNGGIVGCKTSQILNPEETNVVDIPQIAQLRNEKLERFWEIWSKDYIRQLPHAPVTKTKGSIAVGSVVLIKEDNYPKLRWPLGLVTKIFPSKDKLIRTVEVRTQKGLLVRPIQRLHILEINNPEKGGEENVPHDQGGIRTRSGRVVKQVKHDDFED